ncbi:hypothetical protein [Alistipes onderdonkii]|uniref:hypothetical protein n=1 Tax=Alistipes onderdonkii TaxID=328813 RepID=UPI0032C1464C
MKYPEAFAWGGISGILCAWVRVFLLTMCKSSHAARILEINSTNARFFITNTLSGKPHRTFILSFSAQDAPARRLCADRPCCTTARRGNTPPQEKTSLQLQGGRG